MAERAVLWSGGADSTLVLCKLLEMFPTDSLTVISINHSQVDMNAASIKARKIILEKLGKRYKHVNRLRRTEIDIKNVRGQAYQQDGYLAQPGIWLPVATSYLDKDTDLYVGYIKGDDVWHYWHSYSTAFDLLQKVRGNKGVLKAPIEWWSKTAVLQELQDGYDLLDDIFYCEFPRTTPYEPPSISGTPITKRGHKKKIDEIDPRDLVDETKKADIKLAKAYVKSSRKKSKAPESSLLTTTIPEVEDNTVYYPCTTCASCETHNNAIEQMKANKLIHCRDFVV